MHLAAVVGADKREPQRENSPPTPSRVAAFRAVFPLPPGRSGDPSRTHARITLFACGTRLRARPSEGFRRSSFTSPFADELLFIFGSGSIGVGSAEAPGSALALSSPRSPPPELATFGDRFSYFHRVLSRSAQVLSLPICLSSSILLPRFNPTLAEALSYWGVREVRRILSYTISVITRKQHIVSHEIPPSTWHLARHIIAVCYIDRDEYATRGAKFSVSSLSR